MDDEHVDALCVNVRDDMRVRRHTPETCVVFITADSRAASDRMATYFNQLGFSTRRNVGSVGHFLHHNAPLIGLLADMEVLRNCRELYFAKHSSYGAAAALTFRSDRLCVYDRDGIVRAVPMDKLMQHRTEQPIRRQSLKHSHKEMQKMYIGKTV